MRGRLLCLRRGVRGAALIEMLVVLPLLLLVIGGIADFSRSLEFRATLGEVARVTARAASRAWNLDEASIRADALRAATSYLVAAGYDLNGVQTQVRVVDLRLSGNRYTKGVEVTLAALRPPHPYHFLPGGLSPALSGRAFCRLENAPVQIAESGSGSY